MKSGFKPSAGYSLIEGLFVIILLSTVFLFYLLSAKQKAQTAQVERSALQLQNIMQFASTYQIENRAWPTSKIVAEELFGSNLSDSNETKLEKISGLIPYAILSLPYQTAPAVADKDKTDLRYVITLSLLPDDPANNIVCGQAPTTAEETTPPPPTEEATPATTKSSRTSTCYLEKIAELLPSASVKKIDNIKTLTVSVIRPSENVPDGYQVKGLKFFSIKYNEPNSAKNITEAFSCSSSTNVNSNWQPFCVQAINHYDRDVEHPNAILNELGSDQYNLSQYVPVASQVGLFNPSNIQDGTYTENSLRLIDTGPGSFQCTVDDSFVFDAQDFKDQKTLLFEWKTASFTNSGTKPDEKYDSTKTYTAGTIESDPKTSDPKAAYQNAPGARIDTLVIYGCCRGGACNALRTAN